MSGLLTRFCWYHDSPIICQGSNLRSNPRVKNTLGSIYIAGLVVKIEFTWETFQPTLPNHPPSLPLSLYHTLPFLPHPHSTILLTLQPFSTCSLPLYIPFLPATSLSTTLFYLLPPSLHPFYTCYLPFYTPSLPAPSLSTSLLCLLPPSLHPFSTCSLPLYIPSLPATSLSTPLLYLLPPSLHPFSPCSLPLLYSIWLEYYGM